MVVPDRQCGEILKGNDKRDAGHHPCLLVSLFVVGKKQLQRLHELHDFTGETRADHLNRQ